MKTDQVQALESGDWSIFAAPVYTRGFVRNYATLLKLDPEALLNDLDVDPMRQLLANLSDGDPGMSPQTGFNHFKIGRQ